MFVFGVKYTAPTDIYTYGHTLSLHDALPCCAGSWGSCGVFLRLGSSVGRSSPAAAAPNSAMAASSLSTKPTEWYVSPMSLSHQRKKQPELVRRSLIDCAARIVAEAGVGGATIQAVADAAGVTKGGLLHHFPSKQIRSEEHTSELQSLMRISYA